MCKTRTITVKNLSCVNWNNFVKIDGGVYYTPTPGENGVCYKNKDIYKDSWDTICYVPDRNFTEEYDLDEEAFEPCDLYVKEKGSNKKIPLYLIVDGYSHKDLLVYSHYNQRLCDELFANLRGEEVWYMFDGGWNPDWIRFWDFVKPGIIVGYEDDLYKVVSVPPEKDWNKDTKVVISLDGTEKQTLEVHLMCLEKIED